MKFVMHVNVLCKTCASNVLTSGLQSVPLDLSKKDMAEGIVSFTKTQNSTFPALITSRRRGLAQVVVK